MARKEKAVRPIKDEYQNWPESRHAEAIFKLWVTRIPLSNELPELAESLGIIRTLREVERIDMNTYSEELHVVIQRA